MPHSADLRRESAARREARAARGQHGKATFATTEGGRIRISEYDGTPGDPLTTLVRTAGALAEGCTAANPPLAWSPDGNTLAFSVFRLDHSFIGLYTRGERRVRWLAPSMDSDRCPVWSPDGTRLAFVRFRAASIMTPSDGAGGGIAGWLHQAPTFSVMVADVAAPPARPHATRVPVAEAFREVADGSYPGTGENGYGSRPLLWTANGRALVVGSEASGHVHLVSVLASGDVALGTNVTTPLTPQSSASCEAQSWSYAADADALFVAQTCADVLGADALWIQRIPASAGGTVVNVTRAEPNVAVGMPSMVALGGGGVAYLASTHNASTQVVAWRPSQPAPTPLTADAPPKAFSAFVRPRLVSFPSLDGKATIHAQLFEPAGGASAAAAAAIFTHGGSQRQMYGAIHFSPTYANLYTACQQLVLDHGITVLSINYRSGVGYGRDFRLCGPPAPGAPGERRCGSLGALEYDDVKAGRAYVDGLFAKAPPKVGIFGLSYGGLNCLQALSRDPASYAAGVCNAPVFNWVSQLRYDGAKNSTRRRSCRRTCTSSPSARPRPTRRRGGRRSRCRTRRWRTPRRRRATWATSRGRCCWSTATSTRRCPTRSRSRSRARCARASAPTSSRRSSSPASATASAPTRISWRRTRRRRRFWRGICCELRRRPAVYKYNERSTAALQARARRSVSELTIGSAASACGVRATLNTPLSDGDLGFCRSFPAL